MEAVQRGGMEEEKKRKEKKRKEKKRKEKKRKEKKRKEKKRKEKKRKEKKRSSPFLQCDHDKCGTTASWRSLGTLCVTVTTTVRLT